MDRLHFIKSDPYPEGVFCFDTADTISRTVIGLQEWETDICDLMAKCYLPGTALLDIGANLGLNSLGVHRRKPITGTLHLFEPQPDVCTLLKANTQHIPTRRLYNLCLYDAPITVNFQQVPDNVGGTCVTVGAVTNCDQITVATATLDSLGLYGPESEPISLIKMDVEGSEDRVLEGARETLLWHKPVIFIEVWASREKTTFEKLFDLGYCDVIHIWGNDFIVQFGPTDTKNLGCKE